MVVFVWGGRVGRAGCIDCVPGQVPFHKDMQVTRAQGADQTPGQEWLHVGPVGAYEQCP